MLLPAKWTKFEETINRYVVEKMRDDVMKFKPFGWVFIPKMKDALTVSVDNKPIVLCQDCKHYRMDGDSHNVWYRCELNHEDMNDYFFCADGEKEEENAAER